MTATELLDDRVASLEREIEAAEDYRHLVELTPRPRGLARLATEVSIMLTVRSIERRVYLLWCDLETARRLRNDLAPTRATQDSA